MDDLETGRTQMEGSRTDTVRKMIDHAARAGALRAAARQYTDARAGLLKGAGFHSQRVQALADEVCADASH
jgi:hypothetical protein